MSADSCVPCADSGSCCKGSERSLFLIGKIGLAKDLTICRLHVIQGMIDAVAEGRYRGFGLTWGIMFGREGLEDSFFHGAPAVVIDDCVTQDAEEPRRCQAVFAQRRCLCYCAGVGSLKKVLGDVSVPHSSQNKMQKPFSLPNETGDGLWGGHR